MGINRAKLIELQQKLENYEKIENKDIIWLAVWEKIADEIKIKMVDRKTDNHYFVCDWFHNQFR